VSIEPIEVILLAVATFGGAMLQSAIGFGFALVAGPAAFAFLEPIEAVAVLYVLSTVLNLLVLGGEDRLGEASPAQVARVVAWAIPGIVAGLFILLALSKPVLQVLVGIGVVLAVAIDIRSAGPAEPGATRLAEGVAGLTAGVLTTTTATSGPPLVILLRRIGLGPMSFRVTMAALLLSLNVLGSIGLALSGESLALPRLGELALLVTVVMVASRAGRVVFDMLDEKLFRATGLALILATGVASVAAGLWAV
jgi:uncharacterized protein